MELAERLRNIIYYILIFVLLFALLKFVALKIEGII